MTYDTKDEVEKALIVEAERLLPSLMEEIVTPWVAKTVAEILAGRVTSAGPTRSGGSVQVRYRLGERAAASSHEITSLRDQNMDFLHAGQMVVRMLTPFMESVLRTDVVQRHVRNRLSACLSVFFQKSPHLIAKSSTAPSGTSQYRGDIHRVSYDKSVLDYSAMVMAAHGVQEKLHEMVGEAAAMAAKVPYHLFSSSKDRLHHATMKARLLKAMKKALAAGITDAELEEIKNQAIIYQVMA